MTARRWPISSRADRDTWSTASRPTACSGMATRGVLRVKLRATGRACHSAAPENGISAIDLLIDALIRLRTLPLPADPDLGSTYYTIGLIDGGVAPNVVSPHASAEVAVPDCRTTRTRCWSAIQPLADTVDISEVLRVPPVRLHTLEGFESAVFPFTTDVPLLGAWGTPLLFGPGSFLVAHTGRGASATRRARRRGRYVRPARGDAAWRWSRH